MDVGKLYITPKGFVVELYAVRGDYLIIKCWNSDLPHVQTYTSVRANGSYVNELVEIGQDDLLKCARTATVLHEYHGKAKIRFQEELHKRGRR